MPYKPRVLFVGLIQPEHSQIRRNRTSCNDFQSLLTECSINFESLFTNIFIEFAKLCIPSKTIVVREDDKLWYDSEIRRNSSKRDILMKTALSHDVAPGSDITLCNKICKPLVVYRFTGNVMTSITTLRT